MSETKDPGRTRRRASRTAGPPPAEAAATEKLETGAAGTRPDSGTEATTGKIVAGETTVDGAADSPAETVRLDKADGEENAAVDDADPSEPEVAATRSWKRIAALTAAAVLVLGLVGAAVVSVLAVQSTQQRDERRSEYVATARQTVLNLTTIRADTAKEDIDRILTMASGDFRTEFDGRVDPFTEIVKQAKVVSTGEVVEAAVESDDEKSAVILVAAKQTLTNAGSQDQQQRFYRFRVTVQRADDGTLTASDVKFVA
ncbi:hypothetical protein [Nocardia sp. NBC_01329]|uniref:hypothetical protein n=1 Tax=Nocardia sp. NBC_01329 TaxID=2903594 RepID=UPI002E156A8E|nr:hypothetical protein OG405_23500 [Nocardia sp. NBC_01329]